MPVLGGMPNLKRVCAWCGLLLAFEIGVFLFMAAGTYGLIAPLPKPISTDFVSFYAAGVLADGGVPELAYDRVEHYAAEQRATETGIEYNFFYYPPPFLLICTALARLPYIVAFIVFETATLILYLLVARRILGEPSPAVVVSLLAFAPVLWTLGLGQNSFLTAALFGSATLLVDRRPAIAGLLFGFLCYKPQFALLVPVALAAGRRWQSFAMAFVSAASVCLLSLTIFGWRTWYDFVQTAAMSSTVYASGRIPFTGYVNPFGAVRQLGGTPNIAYAVQVGVILTGAAFVAFVWRRDLPLPIRAASLVSWTLVAAPLALFYDLMLGAVAALWLMRDGKVRLADWERIALSGLFLLSLCPRVMAEASYLPIGPVIALALTVIVTARALRCTGILSLKAAEKSSAKAGSAPASITDSSNTPRGLRLIRNLGTFNMPFRQTAGLK